MTRRSASLATLTLSQLLVAILALAPPELAAEVAAEKDAAKPAFVYSPYADAEIPREVLWGDTHVHSSWSPDAGAAGNTQITPDLAFRFAKGETITGHNGQKVALRRPLDFLVVADHSEYLGLYPMLDEGAPGLLATETGARWKSLMDAGKRGLVGAEFAASLPEGKDLIRSPQFQRTVWDRVIENAERHNAPGNFTAFIGYEWSSMPQGANLHRIIVFRDGAEQTSQVVPFRSVDSEDPEALWRYLADYESKTKGEVLAIPHNSNLSAGRMFEQKTFDGKPFTKSYAEQRRRWEPLVEATQIKGDSETAPFLSPDDEFADFGTWDAAAGMGQGRHEEGMYEAEYVRSALGNGLAIADRLGVNPFEFGLIGSTDSHTGLATADDGDFWGKFSSNEPRAGRASTLWAASLVPEERADALASLVASGEALDPLVDKMMTWSLVASGFAGVWAKENTRESIFAAMRRRETYATTGPRMTVRFFGGWSYAEEDAVSSDLAVTGYAKGVPMGGVLTERARRGAPSFLVAALRDPDGANLDRIQIVKQWADREGERHERIYDVAVSGDRRIGPDGRCREAVGNSVDVENARYTNSIGASQFAAVWRDPDFDPEYYATYYVRVLEIPTPRWTTYDASRFGTPLPSAVPATEQERAYTSPIWYTPQS